MILYGFMVRYGENNRWGPGRPPPPVVFRQNDRPWLLGLRRMKKEKDERKDDEEKVEDDREKEDKEKVEEEEKKEDKEDEGEEGKNRRMRKGQRK